jgi:acyl transferase domain-containing protein
MAVMYDNADIAIVGLACRFPGARDAAEFWRNLADGVESITRFSDDEMLEAGVPRAHLAASNYVKAGAVLDEPGGFDAAFFGFVPSEARTMDPQHRLLLELAHTALEDAGCDPARGAGRVGVFAGAAMNTYFMHGGLEQHFAQDYIPTLIVNDKDFLSTRISYKLNLKGPSMTVQTACSTSLVAVHLARQSLLSEETDLALAGAISVRAPHRAGYFADGGGVSSPDGRVRAFDAGANGTLFGSGGGVVVLKRLRDAVADGDTIRAIIKGSAVNNDGAEKAGYTAPSVNSQADAIVEALANSDVEADSISYVEAHGSGTPVGDPIEIRALTKAFRASTQRSGFCAIGSVKTNVGHLDAAAGMAGLIKTVLALQHRQIPASLNFSQPNPEIDFPSTPFFVNTRLTPWSPTRGPRRAGIMSTGMGGTNAHVVLEEAPPVSAAGASAKPNLFVLSARTESALTASADRLRAFLEAHPTTNLDDAAFTLQVGRRAMPHRRFIVGDDRAEIIASLAAKPKRLSAGCTPDGTRHPLVLLLPGVGDHYVGMGRELYAAFPIFRREVDRCAEILRAQLGFDIRDVIYPKNRDWQKASTDRGIDLKKMLAGNTPPPEDEDSRRLNQAAYLQPALFTIEYALARLWSELGLVPQAIVGHSMGEYVAACLAGVFSLEDALRLIVRRTQLVDQLPPGSMLAVTLPEAELEKLLPSDLSIALINGPSLCVVAGPPAAMEEFSRTLTARGVLFRSVQNTHAFHSRLLDPIVGAFEAEVRKVRLNRPKVPFISNVTGSWISDADAVDPAYWARHLNHTARFDDALRTVGKMDAPLLLEAGPGKTLGVLANQHLARENADAPLAVSSLRHHYENQPDLEVLLSAVGKLWLSGTEIRWEKLHAEPRRKIPLPTYPFERQNFWLEAAPLAIPGLPASAPIHKNADPAEWYYAPSWKRLLAKPVSVDELSKRPDDKRAWLFFLDECGVASEIAARLKAAGHPVATVRAGDDFTMVKSHEFTILPSAAEHYDRLIESLPASESCSWAIVHAWAITGSDSAGAEPAAFENAQTLGFYSLLFLAKALAKQSIEGPISLFALSNHLQDVHGREELRPEKSTVLGPCLVIPQEFPNIIVKSIDLELPETGPMDESAVEQILGEFYRADSEPCVAYRHAQRWVQTYEPADLPRPGAFASVFREGGVYLITGGLGNVGREIACYLAKNYRAKLLLVGRSILPPRESWTTWVEAHPDDDSVTRKIQQLAEIEALGGTVCYLNANVNDRSEMQSAFAETDRRFGALHGVIHGAGVVGDQGYGEVAETTRALSDLHFQSKARGVLVLESLIEGRTLDFCLLLSSLASVLGGIGQAAYSAANIYLDTFARRRGREGSTPWLSVNWDVWRTQENVWGHSGPGKTLEELGMTRDEAMQVLETTLTVKRGGQIVVSTGSLDARIRQWIKLESLRAPKPSTSGRPGSATGSREEMEEVSSEDEVEQLVSRAWQSVLGIHRIGANETFFDLGGHSLLALQIVARIRAAYRVDITLRDFFEAPTIARSSALIRDKLIQDIADLTDDEVRELIANTSGQHE